MWASAPGGVEQKPIARKFGDSFERTPVALHREDAPELMLNAPSGHHAGGNTVRTGLIEGSLSLTVEPLRGSLQRELHPGSPAIRVAGRQAFQSAGEMAAGLDPPSLGSVRDANPEGKLGDLSVAAGCDMHVHRLTVPRHGSLAL